ncbi:hypothetical protein LQZ24_03355 [Fructobacillus sp. M1-13]|uniref:Uncharacterized protein n=1 Tax=Fructobacillus papyriferae TaxID=2713171 RepID=A0ABS5QQ79_9LACO|nr:hypothetical protein [Fructobacillus papyriferae]MBS9335265.1 hypothetical protein [Fructobacillus papyriferae]MCD2159066.1 hypothetical protein [Fructobacillus papyriferae]
MPSFLFWALLLLLLLFLLTHLIPILLIVAIIWGIAYYGKKHRNEKKTAAFTEQTVKEARDINDGDAAPESFKSKLKNRSLEKVQAEFQENHALNLGDGLWIDQANQELLLVLSDDQKTTYIRANFQDISTYFVQFESDYSKTFAIHFAGMAEHDAANVTLSKQENDLLGQSPADYLAVLLSRYGMPLKKD